MKNGTNEKKKNEWENDFWLCKKNEKNKLKA